MGEGEINSIVKYSQSGAQYIVDTPLNSVDSADDIRDSGIAFQSLLFGELDL